MLKRLQDAGNETKNAVQELLKERQEKILNKYMQIASTVKEEMQPYRIEISFGWVVFFYLSLF